MGRLEVEYDITNISTLFEESTVPWDNAEFITGKDFTGHLKLWVDGIDPEQAWEELKKLEEKAESCQVALRYCGNRNITFKRKDYPTYHFGDRGYELRSKTEFAIYTEYMRGQRESFGTLHIVMPPFTLEMKMTSSPVPLPQSMPTIPPDLHRMAETIVAADEPGKSPDMVIKLAFIILEEVTGKDALDAEELKMKHVRNFVSHPICHDDTVIAFVSAELPSAKTTDGVQFRRNDQEHVAFVAKYAYPALHRAKELFSEKVKIAGGFLRS